MIDAPHTGTTVQVQAVPANQVVDIRRVLPARQRLRQFTDATASGQAQMGNVTVPAAYAGTVEQAASSNGIPASLLAALLYHESRFEPNVVSSAGAEGIAQFMPATAAGMGIDPTNATQSIEGAAKLLGSYTRQFGSYSDALAAYDAGSSAVERYGGVPPYAETQAYVPAVLSLAGCPGSPAGDRMSAAGTVIATSTEGAGDMPSAVPIGSGGSTVEGAQPFSEVLSLSSPDRLDPAGSPAASALSTPL